MQTVIGLDVGTTGTKAAVCDPQGRVLGKAYCEYDLHFTGDGGVEQNAADWIGAVRTAVREAVAASGATPDSIAAISLSTQGGSVWARGEHGEALTPVMTWMDGRAHAEADDLRMLAGERLYRASGWQVGAGFDAAKLLWLRRNRPEVFEKAVGFDTTLETVNRYLTGKSVTDPTNAAIRILYNIRERRYDPEILSLLGLDAGRLPEVVPTGTVIGSCGAGVGTPGQCACLQRGTRPVLCVARRRRDPGRRCSGCNRNRLGGVGNNGSADLFRKPHFAGNPSGRGTLRSNGIVGLCGVGTEMVQKSRRKRLRNAGCRGRDAP